LRMDGSLSMGFVTTIAILAHLMPAGRRPPHHRNP
jgi:hypothetical protein